MRYMRGSSGNSTACGLAAAQAPGDLSSIAKFEARGNNGRIFPSRQGTPDFTDARTLSVTIVDSAGMENFGYVEFAVPEHDGPYTVLWNKGRAIPFMPVAILSVFRSH
jgi:hypothetical protein